MADKNQTQAHRTFSKWFFVDKHRDASVMATGDLSMPQSGRADMVLTRNGRSTAVEAKTGTTNFPFANWRENQRRWAEVWVGYGNTYWLFITVGNRVGPKTDKNPYPKETILIPHYALLRLEERSSRKSLSYAEIAGSKYRLVWMGDNRWGIPMTHEFYQRHIDESLRISRDLESIQGILAKRYLERTMEIGNG